GHDARFGLLACPSNAAEGPLYLARMIFRRFPRRLHGIAAAVLLACLCPLAAAQDGRVVPASPGQLTLSYAPVVKRVAPAVVNVYAAKVVENRNPLLDDPIFRRFFGNPGAPREQIQRRSEERRVGKECRAQWSGERCE